MRIQDQPIDERPYEKFMTYGVNALTDIELLAILLRTGTKSHNVTELSRIVLSCYKGEPSLISLYQLSLEELKNIKGIGKIKAIQILSLVELSKRLNKQRYMPYLKVDSPDKVSNYFMEELRHKREEHFKIILLDAKCRMLSAEDVSKGSLTASIVHPREVYKVAIQKSAYSVIAMHNHPSGDPTPSQEDIRITSRLKEVGEIVGIPLLDHIIIGDGTYFSLKQESYL